MRNARSGRLVIIIAAIVLAGCYHRRQLAAPPTPDRLLPNVPFTGAPGPGLFRVVIDVVDGPSVVESLSGGSVSALAGGHGFGGSLELSQRMCVSPCVLDMAPGPHELRFTAVDDDSRTSTGFVNVDQQVSAYRHALGTHRNRAWRGFVGWPLALGGAAMDIAFLNSVGSNHSTANFTAGAVAVGLTALGVWLIHGSVIDDQPGSGVQWYPE